MIIKIIKIFTFSQFLDFKQINVDEFLGHVIEVPIFCKSCAVGVCDRGLAREIFVEGLIKSVELDDWEKSKFDKGSW